MSHEKYDRLIACIKGLQNFLLDDGPYVRNSMGYQESIDNLFLGEVKALSCFCEKYSWQDLHSSLEPCIDKKGMAVQALTHIRRFVIPEIVERISSEAAGINTDELSWFWSFVHPKAKELAKPRYEAGQYADAVESVYKEINELVKQIHKKYTGNEADGAGLMTSAFSPSNPSVKLTEMDTSSERNIQQGYMHIFSGAMSAIRNPNAHSNLLVSQNKALHLISLASLLLTQLDERI